MNAKGLRLKVGQLNTIRAGRDRAEVDAWNRTDAPYAADRRIHELVEERARAVPQAPAVVFEGATLVYEELNRLANRLAHRLRAAGAGPEARVGVAVEPSAERVIALLGVLKSGAAYVPLETAHPDERLRWMAEDAALTAIVAAPDAAVRLAPCGLPLLAVDGEGGEETDPRVPGSSRDAAYVIYTSGSTGRPKGVVIEHHSLVNRLQWMQAEYGVGDADRILHKTSYGFDVSVWELFLPLVAGARMVVAPEDVRRDGRALVELIRREAVTILHFVPSLLGAFLEDDGVEACTSLRAVVCSGEALSRELARRFHQRLSCGLHNLYGPTEATIDVTHWACDPESPLAFVPIGRPVWNTRTFVLNERMAGAPVGGEGELYLGGVQVARGYLGRPALTAERFVPDPFGTEAGGRLYRTGDRARFLADGAIEFLGRLDGQVKIRGYRIELGEIEAVLAEHPAVRAAAVLLREDAPGVRRLVAYVAWRAGSADGGGVDALRADLGRRLPAYMVPDVVVEMESLPLTSSGKLDRRSLPAPSTAGDGPRVAPRTDVERRIAALWSELLNVPEIGVTDHFFRIGGDSILSIRLVARARKQGLRFDVKDVFEQPTVAGLAAVARVDEAPEAGDLPDAPLTGPVPLTAAQRDALAGLHGGALFAALAPAAPLHPPRLREALQAVAHHHDALRLRLRPAGADVAQHYAAPTDADAPLEVFELPAAPDWQAALEEAAVTLAAGLDAETGPTFRAALLRAPGGDARLLLAAHPLTMDPSSWPILLDDLETACASARHGDDAGLPPRTRSYRDWARTPGAEAAEACGVGACVGERRERVESRAAHRTTVPAEVARLLLGGAGHAYRATPDEVVVGAVAQALAGDARRISLVRLIDGRAAVPELDLHRTVGAFARMRAVTVAADSQADPGQVVKTVKERLRTAVPEAAADGIPTVEFHWTLARPSALLLRTAPERVRPADAPPAPAEGFRVSCHPAGEGLEIEIVAAAGVADAASVEALMAAVLEQLERLVRHCAQPDAFGYTPSDFPLAPLRQEAIDAAFAHLPGVAEAYPLAPMQDGMLFRGLYWPGSDSYFNQNVLELRGRLDAAALRAAWNHVANRYCILKTGFVWEGLEAPLQYVLEHVEAPWEERDWTGDPTADPRERLEALLVADRDRGLDLAQVPLFRLQLVRLAADHYYLLWSHHHILLDGWCLSLIWGDVFQAYAAYVAGEVPHLPETRPYREFIAWLARQEVGGASERYWKEYLAGYDEVTRFSPVHGHLEAEFDTREMKLSAGATAALSGLAQKAGVTVNAVVQAAWSLMLGVHAGRDEVVHGMTVAGRPPELEGVEHMVGLFINTIPLRVRLDGESTVQDLLRQIQTTMAQANEHAHVPLARIKSWCRASGQHGGPIFDSLIAFENYPEDNLPVGDVAGVDVRDLKAVEKTEYPLGLIVLPGEELIFHVNYDTGHFDIPAIERIESQLRTLLESLPERADVRLREIGVLAEAERRRILLEWNDTAVSWPDADALHRMFERQAAHTPDADAVRDGRECWSYRELNRRANRAAAALSARGVRPGDPVGICMDRSAALAAGILAILKCGASALLLDPAHPPARRELLVRDAGARVVLVEADGAAAAPEGVEALTIGGAPPAAEWDANPARPEDVKSDVAFIIYTSGSTGTPRGVLCPGAGMVNRILWSRDAYPVEGPIRLLQNAGVAFDIMVWELFLPLLTGGTVVAAPGGRNRDMDWLVRTIHEAQINVVHFVPSLFDVFLTHAGAEGCTSLHQVVCGGEALTLRQRRAFAALGLPARLHHAYGPTEASISVTNWECTPGAHPDRVPIGRPIANTRAYVLDTQLRPVPVGVEGDLYVGGAGLAAGYHNDPELTARRFTDDPFVPGGRVYQTGDRARFLADGALEFLGRRDHQVKLRGHRIELGEVDAVLAQHPAVRQAVTVCTEASDGGRQLASFVVEAPEGREGAAGLRAWLGDRLPAWMVPARIIVLDALPLTANGKVDRTALAVPEGEAAGRAPYVAPRNEREAALADIWQELLGVERVGIHDNFFEMAGHSLLLMRMVARVQQAFPDGVHCDISQIFKAPTVAELAALMTGTGYARAGAAVMTLRPVGSRTPLFLVHPGEGLAVAYSSLVPHLPERPLFGINNPRFGDARRAFRSIAEMAEEYVGLIREVEPTGPYLLGGWSFGGVVALEAAARLTAAGESVEAVVMIDSCNFAARAGEAVDRAWIRDRVAARGIHPDSSDGRALRLEIENNGSLAEAYTPTAWPGRVLLLQAQQGDPDDPARGDLEANGWSSHLLPGLEVEAVDGEHARLLEAEFAAGVGRAIHRALDRQAAPPAPAMAGVA